MRVADSDLETLSRVLHADLDRLLSRVTAGETLNAASCRTVFPSGAECLVVLAIGPMCAAVQAAYESARQGEPLIREVFEEPPPLTPGQSNSSN